jgi:hypothetical protein
MSATNPMRARRDPVKSTTAVVIPIMSRTRPKDVIAKFGPNALRECPKRNVTKTAARLPRWQRPA